MFHIVPSLGASVDHIQGKSLVGHRGCLGNVLALSLEFGHAVRCWDKLGLLDFKVPKLLERHFAGSSPVELQGVLTVNSEIAALYVRGLQLDDFD